MIVGLQFVMHPVLESFAVELGTADQFTAPRQAVYDTERMADRVRAEISKEELAKARAELADARRRAEELQQKEVRP